MDVAAYVYLATVFMILVGLAVILRVSCKEETQESRQRRRNRNRRSEASGNGVTRTIEFIDCSQSDQNSIYNISSRVQGQNQTQYPDAYLSVDHITVTNELNKPPKYDDAPPSYEEAIKIAMAHSNSIQTFQAEQAQTNDQPQSSTSDTSTVTVVVPAVPNRTTE